MGSATGDETGGGVMIIFTADVERRNDVADAMGWIMKTLHAQRLMVARHNGNPNMSQPSFLIVNATREVMETEAQHVKLMKEDNTGSLLEFRVEGAADVFKGYNEEGFFTAAEQALLVGSLVDAARGAENPPKGVSQEMYSYGAVYALRLAGADVHGVNNYFGPEMAVYFAWMNYYLRWLIPPAIAGMLVHAHRELVGRNTDNYRWVPLYALLVVLWGALFQIYWKRESAEWSWRFGTALVSEDLSIRPAFRGEERISPITGEKERYYPTRARLVRYFESAVVTGGMLSVALVIMICSLNLQGYMIPGEDETVTRIESWFYVPYLSAFAERGGVFDSNGYYRGYVPASLGATVVHVLFIQSWNKVYRTVATRLTDRENHRTEEEYQNNLMMKRFLFEAFDCYVSLFYLAFVQFDMMKLRNELVSLYTIDSIRRIATECLVPLLSQTFSWDGHVFKKNAKKQFKIMASKNVPGIAEADQIKGEKYDSFDDYLEMVIQYGYMTLFASAFPSASTLSLLTTFVEIKADTFKLLFVYKRPVPRRVSGIGNWQKIMDITTVLAVTTNCMIFALSSEQLMQWAPKWYLDVDGPDGPRDQEFQVGMGRYVVGFCFGIEHLLMALVATFWMLIPSHPNWVRQKVAHVHYLREKGARQASREKRD